MELTKGEESDGVGDLLNQDIIQTPSGGRLVLNPNRKLVPRVPLYPECEEPIKRVEHDHAPVNEEEFVTVEFECGCDELQRFSGRVPIRLKDEAERFASALCQKSPASTVVAVPSC